MYETIDNFLYQIWSFDHVTHKLFELKLCFGCRVADYHHPYSTLPHIIGCNYQCARIVSVPIIWSVKIPLAYTQKCYFQSLFFSFSFCFVGFFVLLLDRVSHSEVEILNFVLYGILTLSYCGLYIILAWHA